MAALTIGEVARRTALQPSTLRYYEQRGLLPAPLRVHGQRRYAEEIVAVVAAIKVARRAGFTLREINVLFHTSAGDAPLSTRWQVMARQKLDEIETLLLRIADMKHVLEVGLQCTCTQLSECTICDSV